MLAFLTELDTVYNELASTTDCYSCRESVFVWYTYFLQICPKHVRFLQYYIKLLLKMSCCSFTFVLVASLCTATLAVPRPIYNIGHMVNSVAQIDEFLGLGANALEADVTFSEDGTPEEFYHGFPCDFGRYCWSSASIENYINALRDRTMPSSTKFTNSLVLMMFDVKLKPVKDNFLFRAGGKFADMMLIPLYKNNPTKMKVIISVPKFSMGDFIKGALLKLKNKNPEIINKLGFEFSDEKQKKAEEIEKKMKELGVAPGHAWLSCGITNWLPIFYLAQLKSLVKYRDSGDYFSKVYAWTLDYKSTAKKYLKIDLDGVIANYPNRVNDAIDELNSSGEKELKLATLNDDPFKNAI